LRLPLRVYLTEPADPALPCIEPNFGSHEREVEVPARETAVVLVDVWHDHYIATHLERARAIVRGRIVPAIQAARQLGIPIVHAPSPPVAKQWPQYARYALPAPGQPVAVEAETWPPPAFRRREGPYAAFARPRGPVMAVAPEPDDPVIATGAELHHYLAGQRILHLVYAGFAANMCVPFRDYGIRAMRARGYHCILLRDCTTAIEGADTYPELRATFQAIRELEITDQAATTTAEAFIAACQHARQAELVGAW